jgi:signal transduction histidine kinase
MSTTTAPASTKPSEPACSTASSRLDEARDADRGGSGLGLAIAASIAAAHGGGVTAGRSPLGGARVSLWLPAHDQADAI